MDIPSLKKHIIQEYGFVPSYENLQDYKLVLITANGTITGKPVLKDDEDETAFELSNITKNFVSDYKETYSLEKDKQAPGNDGFIMIKDVKIVNLNHVTHLPFLIVFYDQIIGVSLGKFENNS